MASKRKFSAVLSDSDDDEPSMGKQVLPVANLPAEFDGHPIDGLQYLFTVRRDARLLPHITRAENPYEMKEKTPKLPAEDSDANGSHPAMPSEDWRDVFLRHFKNFRKNSVQPTIHVPIDHPGPSHKVMPDRKERDKWWAFLTGRPSSEWDPPKKPKLPKMNRFSRDGNEGYGRGMRGYGDGITGAGLPYDDHGRAFSSAPHETWLVDTSSAGIISTHNSETSLPTPSETPAPPDHADLDRKEAAQPLTEGPMPEPTPTLMQHIDHRYALHLLMYFGHWIKLHLEEGPDSSYRITEVHARWMFILLSRVDDYVSPDETSLLRSLARACISLLEGSKRRLPVGKEGEVEQRPTVDESSIGEGSCWMIITAVVGIWGQRDLWMDAEAMLNKVQPKICML